MLLFKHRKKLAEISGLKTRCSSIWNWRYSSFCRKRICCYMKWFCNRIFSSGKKQDWKVFQPHRLRSKWQILKIYENLTSFWPTAWLCDEHRMMTTRPLCCDHCLMTSVWPLCTNKPLCANHCVTSTLWQPL